MLIYSGIYLMLDADIYIYIYINDKLDADILMHLLDADIFMHIFIVVCRGYF